MAASIPEVFACDGIACLSFRFAALKNALEIADGVKPADRVVSGMHAGFARHRRHVIYADGDVQPAVLVELDQLGHREAAVVVEGLAEGRLAADGVAEVDEEDLVCEFGNDFEYILAHHRIARLAEGDAQVRAVRNFAHSAADIVVGDHDAGNVAKAG